MATVVFSHGFGVRADARGMFTQIAAAFPEHTFVPFDYNHILENGDVEVAPLDAQAAKLESVIDAQDGDVIVVAHSQGCVIAGLIDLEKVRKVILLAPPVQMSMQRVIDKLMNKQDAEVNLAGVSKLPRSDGTTTHISKEYIESVKSVNPLEHYEKIAGSVDTTIVRCTQDEVLGMTNVDTVPGAKHIDMASDHDFTGDSRSELLALLATELS